mgnify:CR=1 FL=1
MVYVGVCWRKNEKRGWRKEGDLNPRNGKPFAAFRVRCIQPLCHLSVRKYYIKKALLFKVGLRYFGKFQGSKWFLILMMLSIILSSSDPQYLLFRYSCNFLMA